MNGDPHRTRTPEHGLHGSATLSLSLQPLPWRPGPNAPHVLARIGFGEEAACDSLERLILPLPPIGGEPLAEVWSTDRPVHGGQDGDLLLRGNEDLVFGLIGPQPDDDIEFATLHAYERIFQALASYGALHLIRTWNFFSRIHERPAAVERYGLFCRGRHRALSRHLSDFEPSLPAASAIGSRCPGLIVCFLAFRRPGLQLENPRQLSAFRYPPRYAPKSPSFSRSILCEETDGYYRLYVSGTAAIVGHTSRHPGELLRQLSETCDNLEALLAAASERAGVRLAFSLLRVYLRERADTAGLREILADRFGHVVPVLFLQGDICRRDLLVEVEGVAESASPSEASSRDR